MSTRQTKKGSYAYQNVNNNYSNAHKKASIRQAILLAGRQPRQCLTRLAPTSGQSCGSAHECARTLQNHALDQYRRAIVAPGSRLISFLHDMRAHTLSLTPHVRADSLTTLSESLSATDSANVSAHLATHEPSSSLLKRRDRRKDRRMGYKVCVCVSSCVCACVCCACRARACRLSSGC